LEVDVTEVGALQQIVGATAPSLIVNAVNLATLYSQRENGYQGLIRFYAELYEVLRRTKKPVHYIQIGTTGSGGLGFDIPFTHGGPVEDMPIIHKAAFAGIGSQLLMMIQRSFSVDEVRVSEVKPALAIFNPEVTVENIEQYQIICVDGGESGAYTYDELALLTKYMGYTTIDRVVEKVLAVVKGEVASVDSSKHDITQLLNVGVLNQDDQDTLLKKEILQKMRVAGEGKQAIPATGNLGPPSVTRDLLLAAALLRGEGLDGEVMQGGLQYLQSTKPDLLTWLTEQNLSARMEELRGFSEDAAEPWQVVARILDLRHTA